MKALLPVIPSAIFALLPGLALAHPGHLAEVAGHDHWVAGAAIGIALGVALWGVLKGRKDEAEDDEAEEANVDEEPQEA